MAWAGGQVNQLLWPVEMSGETRASGEGEVGWRKGRWDGEGETLGP